MTAPGTFRDGGRLTGAALRGIAPLCAYKSIAQAVASSVTLQSDDALLLQLAANAVYYFRCKLGYSGAASGSGDLKLGWSLPGSASMDYALYGNHGGSATPGWWETQSSVPGLNTEGAGASLACVMRGTVTTGEAPGAMQLQWCQNTSSATATTVLAGSSLIAWRIA